MTIFENLRLRSKLNFLKYEKNDVHIKKVKVQTEVQKFTLKTLTFAHQLLPFFGHPVNTEKQIIKQLDYKIDISKY